MLFLIRESTKGINVISECLNTAIANAKAAIVRLGMRAISAQSVCSRELKRVYAIPNPPIQIASCLMLSPSIIGSSFSICTGILYCTIPFISEYYMSTL